ncbi:LIC_13387 family protein [Pseudomonas zhanjiangensis]|uniref:DUF1304 domain-containing protein n=1 Tax=Pseudomonas zhanjiangensis TaxID=3239015 RepID=A0ABV3YZ57_9PSED
MSIISTWLITASAAIIGLLGLLHLLLTFLGDKLTPRDESLHSRMQAVSPRISRETSMWQAWIGFNASHSFGALLFGALYGYLALVHGAVLGQSPFLLLLGQLLLLGYLGLAWRYWFSVPRRAILLSTALYTLGLLLHWS